MPRSTSGGAKGYLVAAAALILLAMAALWLGLRGVSTAARDFEECAQQVQAERLPNDERNHLITDCNVRFAGRRKAGGGYSYYDFMQDRSFDIAGPNPTAEESKRIDRAYMAFLDAQRRDMLSSELTSGSDVSAMEPENAQLPVGPPAALSPTIAAERAGERSEAAYCHDGSLACGWAKLAEAMKNVFALSAAKTQP